jgi:hypothetical protein
MKEAVGVSMITGCGTGLDARKKEQPPRRAAAFREALLIAVCRLSPENPELRF